jgi:hypothetical protein
MMGELAVAQDALFYCFNLDRPVLANHLLRLIDQLVDLSCIREHPCPDPLFDELSAETAIFRAPGTGPTGRATSAAELATE